MFSVFSNAVHKHISRTTRVIFTNILCMLPIAVTLSSCGGVTKSYGEGAILGVFFPIDNVLYSIAFETYTKMAEAAEPIEMPFGMMTRVRL